MLIHHRALLSTDRLGIHVVLKGWVSPCCGRGLCDAEIWLVAIVASSPPRRARQNNDDTAAVDRR
jgi:hypothetical protein